MSSKSKRIERYQKEAELDFGDNLSIVSARDRKANKQPICILSLPAADWVRKWLQGELSVRLQLHHPHILRICDIFTAANNVHLVFERPPGENLLGFLIKYRPTECLVRTLFQQLMFSMEYLHYAKIYGIDLVLERIFFSTDNGMLKIVDFGVSVSSEKERQEFSLSYLAPEQITDSTEAIELTEKTDIWRCGVILYCMLFSQFPFAPDSSTGVNQHTDHLTNILRGRWSIPKGKTISKDGFDLLKRMLNVDADQRISLMEITRHPWYLNDLPKDVLSYRFVKKPVAGLPEKVRQVVDSWSSQERHVSLPEKQIGMKRPLEAAGLSNFLADSSERVIKCASH